MLTRQGVTAIVAGGLSLAVGRLFGVLELFVVGAGFFAAALLGVAWVHLRRVRLDAIRWIHPAVLTAGDTGRIDLLVTHRGALRSTPFQLTERIRRHGDPDQVARMAVGSLSGGATVTVGYRLPTTRRGIIAVGPLEAEARDPLGVARRRQIVAGLAEVIVAPRAHLLPTPELGRGAIGRHLLDQARRLGPGEFHSLRDYADGDEPRSIHWKASARSEELKVRQHTAEGLRRCTVVLDPAPGSYLDEGAFERAVTIAASIVHSADHAGLTTRFVAGDGLDLRGPDVATSTLRYLASVRPGDGDLGHIDRDPGEGLGLVVLVGATHRGAAWQAVQQIVDPTLTAMSVATCEPPRPPLALAGRTEEEFLTAWRQLTGSSGGAQLAGHAVPAAR